MKHLNNPHIIHNSKLISRDTLKSELDQVKQLVATKLDDITNFKVNKLANG